MKAFACFHCFNAGKLITKQGELMKQWNAILALVCAVSSAYAFDQFITRRENKLYAGEKEFRFIGANMPGLVVPYDFTLHLAERMYLPTPWELEDAMKTCQRMGMTVLRTWNLPMRGATETAKAYHYVLGPGQFNEKAFENMDHLLALANQYQIRLILSLNAEAGDYLGGIGTYAAYRGKKRSEFWSDPQLRADFKQTIAFVLSRTNTVSGVAYRDDKAVLAWQFGNEMYSATPEWLSEMAAYMKQLAPKQLVAETRHQGDAPPVIDANIDLYTRHYYSDYKRVGTNWVMGVKEYMAQLKGQRPFFVGEFGPYVDGKILTTTNVISRLKQFYAELEPIEGYSGALLWSMYFHNEQGGFYWHQIFTYPSVWSYHFPGFPSGDAQCERGIMQATREAAFRIRGCAVPQQPAPDAPEVIPFSGAPLFSWKGSAGAEHYRVERARSAAGPWLVAGARVSDADVAYRPLFSDTGVTCGSAWYYRVIACNEGGESAPSKPFGPVTIDRLCWVDELQDLQRAAEHSAGLMLDNTYNARYAEYLFRAVGHAGDFMTYRLDGAVSTLRATAFVPASCTNATLLDFGPDAQVTRRDIHHLAPPHAKPQQRQTQVEYCVAWTQPVRAVTVTWKADVALDRVEIDYRK